jgi:hypothetical protein
VPVDDEVIEEEEGIRLELEGAAHLVQQPLPHKLAVRCHEGGLGRWVQAHLHLHHPQLGLIAGDGGVEATSGHRHQLDCSLQVSVVRVVYGRVLQNLCTGQGDVRREEASTACEGRGMQVKQ